MLLQLLSCALCGSKVLAALAASAGSSSTSSSTAPVAASSGQAPTQSKSSTKKSKKEEKEKEKEGECPFLVLVTKSRCSHFFWIAWLMLLFGKGFYSDLLGPTTLMPSSVLFWFHCQLHLECVASRTKERSKCTKRF